MTLPDSFLQIIKKQLLNELEDFQKSLYNSLPTSIRFNSKKQFKWKENFEKVKWNNEGVYLVQRPIFTLDPLFHAGAYYVQEASSMFLAEVLKQTTHLKEGLKVLDLCAAPGGKSTLLLSQISSNSLLVANEVIKSRYKILQENLMRWGSPNIASCNQDPNELAGLANFFDVILIDAPCSGEGMFRKDAKAVQEWSLANVQLCSTRQKRIFSDTFQLLKKDGLLIYSTCTYNEQENGQNVDWLIENFSLTPIPIKLNANWNIVEKRSEKGYGYQFYPHKVKGEGFFISAFRKKEGAICSEKSKKRTKDGFRSLKKLQRKKIDLLQKWIAKTSDFAFYETPNAQILALPKQLIDSYLLLDKVLKKKQFGIPIGSFKRNDFIPSHHLALSTIIHPDLPAITVSKEMALAYLKKENFTIPDAEKGWHLIRYQALNLGWIKVVPGRINNYLPKEYRIRMSIN